MQESLASHGQPAARTAETVAIYASIRSGKLGGNYEQHQPLLG